MRKLLATLAFLASSAAAHATSNCGAVPFVFSPGTTISSSQVNANFSAVVGCINNIPIGVGAVTPPPPGSPPTTPTAVTVDILTSFRNRLINGCHAIDQRNNGAMQSGLGSGATYTNDRHFYKGTQSGKWNAQRTNVSTPLATMPCTTQETLTVASASSVGATDQFSFGQVIEAQNVQDLQLGTANAEPMTLSFWANSNNGCTCSGAIQIGGYSFVFNYTLIANTWTYVQIPVPADTVSSGDVGVYLSLGCGSSFQATPGSWLSGTFYCSGAANSTLVSISGEVISFTADQLEPGTSSTPFEQRTNNVELQLCQRYHQRQSGWKSGRYTQGGGTVPMPSFGLNTPMRTTPSATASSTTFTGGCSGINLNGSSVSVVQTSLTGCNAAADITGTADVHFDAEINP